MSAERILKIALFDPHREGNQWIEIPEWFEEDQLETQEDSLKN
jgi:hypothetical protein